MFFPFVSVTLIGLYFAFRAPITLSQSKAIKVALIGAWLAYLIGAFAGLVVSLVLPGAFWIGLAGHAAAYFGAKAAVEGEVAGHPLPGTPA